MQGLDGLDPRGLLHAGNRAFDARLQLDQGRLVFASEPCNAARLDSGISSLTLSRPPSRSTCWRGNRRLLPTEPGSMQVGDIVVLPHLPTACGPW